MLEANFRKIIQSKEGCALICAGSDSDADHIQRISQALKKYKIPHQVKICSAHKQLQDLIALIDECNSLDGHVTYIAIAGGTDALSGTLSYHAMGPVVSCPPDSPNPSCLTNPPGSSNATIVRPSNLGRFIAQLYAGFNPRFKTLLAEEKEKKIEKLRAADKRYADECYLGES